MKDWQIDYNFKRGRLTEQQVKDYYNLGVQPELVFSIFDITNLQVEPLAMSINAMADKEDLLDEIRNEANVNSLLL